MDFKRSYYTVKTRSTKGILTQVFGMGLQTAAVQDTFGNNKDF